MQNNEAKEHMFKSRGSIVNPPQASCKLVVSKIFLNVLDHA